MPFIKVIFHTHEKFKPLLYRYTGIYLAYREELEYVGSKEYWTTLLVLIDADMAPIDCHDLTVGLWQAKEGFTRPASFVGYSLPRPLGRVLRNCHQFYLALKWDLADLFKSFKKFFKS